ncbi:MAG: ATP-dependent zinc metalloprotease FtsH [Chloroflexi bacterium]|nr:ATP-dependent zinc metalloprotease FtsH [Chloroflexota bacterium]
MAEVRFPKKLIFLVSALVIVALLSVGLYLAKTSKQAEPATIPISDMLNRAEQKTIKEATVEQNLVTVVDNEGKRYRAFKEEGQPIGDTLRKNGVKVTVVQKGVAPWQAPLVFAVPVALLALVLLLARYGKSGLQLPLGPDRRKVGSDALPGVTFADVAGVDEAKYELTEVVEFLKYPDKFRALGARIPKGVLLVGPPGTGKTLISKAVAGEAAVPFLHISASEFVEVYVGVGASRVRSLFQRAKKNAPAIVFVDEIDAVGRHRSAGHMGGNDERDQTLNQLLVEMDGFDTNSSVVVIAATNRPDTLDQALLRPGRFDRRVMLDSPDMEGRRQILEVHAKNKPLEAGVELAALARQTAGLSGADLANVLNEAAILAVRADKKAIGQPELEEAMLRVMAGPEKRSRVISEQEKKVIAYHEAGHAVMMRTLKHADPVRMVSVVSRSRALGLTVQRPEEDRYLLSKEQLEARMVVALGGRAAEEIIFSTVTTGAAQDIEQATAIARRMVAEFGMSPLGLMAMKAGVGGDPSEKLSDALAGRVDEAVKVLVEECYELAKVELTTNMDKLVKLAEHLQTHETAYAADLDELFGTFPALPN